MYQNNVISLLQRSPKLNTDFFSVYLFVLLILTFDLSFQGKDRFRGQSLRKQGLAKRLDTASNNRETFYDLKFTANVRRPQ